jgi:predicted transcriptional regulator
VTCVRGIGHSKIGLLNSLTKIFVDSTKIFVIIGLVTPRPSKLRSPKPTNSEVAILRVLWHDGPSTVRQIRAALEKDRGTTVGHTTALKLVQIMCDKGLLDRDESNRPQVFRPRVAEQETQRQMAKDFLDRVFGGSARKLVLQLLGIQRASEEEIREVEELLDRIEKERE